MSMTKGVRAIILAAGEGTRMKSASSKVTHELCGKAVLEWVLLNLEQADIEEKLAVVGFDAERVKSLIGDGAECIEQEERRGTAHAVRRALENLADYTGTLIVIYGSMPLISSDTIQLLLSYHEKNQNAATGIENGGLYCFNKALLSEAFLKLTAGESARLCHAADADDKNNTAALTDESKDPLRSISAAFIALSGMGYKTEIIGFISPDEAINVTDRVSLCRAAEIMRRHILRGLMLGGVTIIDPTAVYIDAQVKVGRDTQILPGTIIQGSSAIGEGCVIGPNSRIVSSVVGNGVVVENSVVVESTIDNGSKVGPFAYLRPGSAVGSKVKIGDFVEIKKSKIGDETKISHLTYVGDAEVGRNVNIGCGVVFVNYNGKVKSKTIVGDNAFIGCNTNLIAPVEVEEDTYIAAGSTITERVPKDSLAIARQRQINKEAWVTKRNMKRGTKEGT